jgi:pilus assembly protein FimV
MSPNMHSSKRPKTGSFHLKTLSAAVVTALLFSNAYAAGLGKLTVLSALGQPLRAEIELTSVSKDEAGNLIAKLASPDAFRQANIDASAALASLRFSVEQRGDHPVVRVTSAQPLNEPFIDMLMELSGPNGKLVREYTFLLDPAEMRSTQSAQMAPSVAPQMTAQRDITKAAPAPSASEQPAPERQKVRQVAPKVTASDAGNAAAANEYKTKSGDTLSHIASRMKGSGVSLDQMLVALYRANPNAFVGENMNRLRSGQILSVPTADAAKSISTDEAKQIVLAQSTDFSNYRAKLAGQVAAAEPQKAAESKQSAAGKITAKVAEPASPDNESKDKLKLSKSTALSNTPASKTAEDKIASDKAANEASSRVKELEKNVNDLQKILEVKNKGMADQQKQADAKTDTKADVPAAATASAASAPTDKPAETKPAANTDNASAPVAASAPMASVPATPATPAKPKRVVPPTPVAQPSFLDDLLDNPYVVPGLGALLVGVGALGILGARRRRQKKNFEDSIITDSSLKANSLFGSTGGQSVDTNNSVFNSSFAPSVSQLDSNEVDPVAEADVYIAYGRDAQAEEILKEALRTQPDRNAVRVKLLEIYANRKDSRAFEVLATELYGLTKGEGEEWAQAATMGRVLEPSNPLYASDKTIAAAPAAPVVETPVVPEAKTEEPVASAAADAAEPKIESNEINFDLGDDFKSVEVPNTIPRPEAAEPQIDMGSIDLDFLDQPATAAEAKPLKLEEPAAPVAESPALSIEEPALSLDIPSLPEETTAPAAETKEPAPLEFDLSDINLELPKTTEAVAETSASAAPLSANHAEMATKLDLAVAYQEIGDKEGARELLDEVLKGGSPEQSEKAKSLLLELA